MYLQRLILDPLCITQESNIVRQADTAATGVDRVVTGSVPIDTGRVNVQRDVLIPARYTAPSATTSAIDSDGTPDNQISLVALIVSNTLFPSGFDVSSLPQQGVITLTAPGRTARTCYTSRTDVLTASSQFIFSPAISLADFQFFAVNDFTATVGGGLASDIGLSNLIAAATNVSMNDLYAIHKYFWSDYQNLLPSAFVDSGTTALLKAGTNSSLVNITLTNTGTYSKSGDTITVKGNNIVTPASEELRSIHVNNIDLNGGYIQGGRLAAGTITNPLLTTTTNPAFRGVEFTEATTISVDITVNSTLVIDDATTITGSNITISRTGGTTGTLFVSVRPAIQSQITLGTGVEFAVEETIMSINIANIPVGGYYIIRSGSAFNSTVAAEGTRSAGQNTVEFRSIAPSGSDTFTQIVGLGAAVTTLRVLQSSNLRATRVEFVTVTESPGVTQTYTVSESTNQVAGIAQGLTITDKTVSIRSTLVQSSEAANLFNGETAQSQVVVQVDGFSILDNSTPAQINQLCAASRATANYARALDATLGNVSTSGSTERDIWQFTGGNQVIVLNGDVAVHSEIDTSNGLQILPGYTVSTSSTTFTAYTLANQHLAVQLGTFALGTGSTRAPQVIGQRPYSTETVEGQVTGLSTQITGVGTQVTGVATQVTGVGTQVTGIGTQVTGVSTQLTTAVTTVNNNTDSQFQEQDDKLRPAFDETVLGIPGSGTRNFPSGGN